MEGGHPLKQWREARGLTQSEVAAAVGVTANTIARIEQGNQLPRPPLIKKLIEYTGLTLNDILIATIEKPEKRRRGRPRKPRP
jgi:transcriptional regulator with XRE-family HTH domain